MPAVADLKHKFSQDLVNHADKDLRIVRAQQAELIRKRARLLTEADQAQAKIAELQDRIDLLKPLLERNDNASKYA